MLRGLALFATENLHIGIQLCGALRAGLIRKAGFEPASCSDWPRPLTRASGEKPLVRSLTELRLEEVAGVPEPDPEAEVEGGAVWEGGSMAFEGRGDGINPLREDDWELCRCRVGPGMPSGSCRVVFDVPPSSTGGDPGVGRSFAWRSSILAMLY